MDDEIVLRDVLLSSGRFTPEVSIVNSKDKEIYESCPSGHTVGLKEAPVEEVTKEEFNEFCSNLDLQTLNQSQLDELLSEKFGANISTPFSLAFLRFLSHKAGHRTQNLFKYVSENYSTSISIPDIICNILNGGKHAGNGLDVCEFMIIPDGETVVDQIETASEIYTDLKEVLRQRLGKAHCMVGREGGFSPNISDTHLALRLINEAIRKRNENNCDIALDVAANNFSQEKNGEYMYFLNDNRYDSKEMTQYYLDLKEAFPNLIYLEDPYHENDVEEWGRLRQQSEDMMIVGDDLTVSNKKYLEKHEAMYDASILKVNQVGTVSDTVNSFAFCDNHDKKTILSQRSGETDSSILTHLATGLGSDYIKAGAPARERIVKYNELIRLKDIHARQ